MSWGRSTLRGTGMEQILLNSLPVWAMHLVLGGVVCRREPRQPSHQAFAACVLALVLWSISTTMAYALAGEAAALPWARCALVAGSLIGHTFVGFCQVFPERQDWPRHTAGWTVGLCGLGITVLCLTPLVLTDIARASRGAIQRHYGPFYFSRLICAS